jgi:hypothetical protein
MATTNTATNNGMVSLKGKGLESLVALIDTENDQVIVSLEPVATEQLASEEIALANKAGNPEPKTAKKSKAKTQPKIEVAPIEVKEEFSDAIDVLCHSGRTAIFHSKDIHKAGKYQRTDVYALIGDGLDWALSQLNPETGAILKSEVASVTFSRFDGIEFLSMKRDPEFMSEVLNGFLYNLQHATTRQARIADRLFAVSLVAMTLIRGLVASDNIRTNAKQSPITPAQWQTILDRTCELFSWFSQDDRTNAEKFLRSMKAI